MHAAVAVFLVLAFGFSWATAELYFRLTRSLVAGDSDLLGGPAAVAGCIVLLFGCIRVAFDRRRGDHVQA